MREAELAVVKTELPANEKLCRILKISVSDFMFTMFLHSIGLRHYTAHGRRWCTLHTMLEAVLYIYGRE